MRIMGTSTAAQAIDTGSNATVYSELLSFEKMSALGAQFFWTGTPTSTLTFQTTDKEDPDETTDDDWHDESVTFPSQPAGSASDTKVHLENIRARWARFKVATSGGSGTMEIFASLGDRAVG